MAEIKNVDQLPGPVQQRFVPFLEKMVALHGKNLISVWIYGSATGVNFQPDVSDINSACVFRQLDPSVSRRSLKDIARAEKQKIIAPLFLTREYIRSSLDVFPIEFFEMKENHVLVYGEDVWATLEIKGSHIRLFCEQQIKGKLIRIQQAYLELGLDDKAVLRLAQDSLKSLLPIFRNLLRLKSKSPAVKKEDVLAAVGQDFGVDSQVFLRVHRSALPDGKIPQAEIQMVFDRYLEEIRKLSQAVDQL